MVLDPFLENISALALNPGNVELVTFPFPVSCCGVLVRIVHRDAGLRMKKLGEQKETKERSNPTM